MITKRSFLGLTAAAPLWACAPKRYPDTASNPALRTLSDRGDRDIDRIIEDLNRIAKAPPKPVQRGGGPTAREKRLISENALIEQAYQRDAKATLKLIRVIVPKLDKE